MTDLTIHGAGGGGKSSKQRTPTEAPNTLRSVSKGRILDLIAHGPIHGLVNGLQSIYLDDTPLQNPDGSFNFDGVTVHTRNGYPDQDYIPGFPAVENTISVSSEVTHELPIIRTTSNPEIDAAVVTVQVQGLTSTDANTGDIRGSSVSLAIDVRPQGGAWRTVLSDTISGKTNSAYQRSYRVPMDGVPPFEIKVRRTTPDSDTARVTDKLAWTTLTEVVDTKLSYPDSALVGIELDAALFGSSMPSRSYDMKLSIINVPSNYDPLTRTYTGMWDGLFKKAWTDNPAWAFYDLATDPVIGADVKNVDKWSLYQIGRYCDELVPDGYGGMEPRFTINTVFADRQDAINVLADLASVFRGMCYWGSDSLVAVGDMPADPVKLVTPANVINGEFEYSGTSLRERHSVAIVMWNDPDDNYRQKPEFVEDPESIELFGWRETQVTALGCTSRGQARRLGKWILYSERAETQTVNYAASMDHADLRPGDFIELADPDQAGARMGGRVLQAGTNALTLDKVPEQTASDTWFLSVTMPNGSIERKEVLSFSGDTVTLLEPFSVEPLRGAVWVLTSLSVRLPIYRVTAVTEDAEKLEYKITATEHDPTKYSRVELDLVLPDLPTSYLPTGAVAPPMDIVAKAYTYLAGGVSHQAITISWTPSDDVRVVEYILEAQGPRDVSFRTAYTGAGTAFDELDADAGEWMFRLKAVSSTGRSSPWVARTVQISNMLMPVRPDSVDVSVATFSISLFPRGAYPGAVYEFWRASTALTDAQIESNAVRLSVSTDLVDTGLRSGTQYFYYVRGSNAYGLSAWYPVQATTLEDFDDILDALDTDIRKPGGLFEEMVGEAKTAVAEGVADEAAAIVQADLDVVRADLAEAKAEMTLLDGAVDNLAVGVTNLEMMNELETVRYLATIALHEGSSARAVTEEATRADEDSALATRITTLQSEFDTNKATVTQELATLASADQAIATRIDNLEVQVGDDMQAQITSEAVARADADSALATQITQLKATVDNDVAAAISSEATARADADGALSTRIDTLTSSTNDQFASVSQQFTAQTSYTDGAVARAVTTATVNGKKAVFGISVNGTVAEIGAIADRFYIYNPAGGTYTLAFAVVNGQTVIQDALIRDGSINTAKIADAAITTAKIAEAAIGSAEIKNAAIDSAKIKDGSITSAKIGNAQVDTLQLAGNSVTVPYYMQTASAISISTSWVTMLTSGVVTYPEETNVLLVCAVQTTKVSGTDVGTTETIVEVLNSSGTTVLTVPISNAIIYNFSTFAGANSGAFMGNAVLAAGSYIFRVRSRAQYASPVTIYRASLSANGVMR